jgi:hypothetical protein
MKTLFLVASLALIVPVMAQQTDNKKPFDRFLKVTS